jgi:hypothetical protein
MSKRSLQDLLKHLHPGQPINWAQWLQLKNVLDCVIEGYDIRKQHEIKPKTGKRPAARGIQKWMVLQFLALCADDPAVPVTVHLGTVAREWGITSTAVRRFVDKHRADMEPHLEAIGLVAIFESVPILQTEYRRLSRNTRQ